MIGGGLSVLLWLIKATALFVLFVALWRAERNKR